MLYCLLEHVELFRQFFHFFLHTSQWEQMTSQDMANLDPQGHGWQDLCKGPLNIAIFMYLIYKLSVGLVALEFFFFVFIVNGR